MGTSDGSVVGWISTRLHDLIRDARMRMIMVETGGDPGHLRARATYEAAGYQRWPVARYFKEI